MFVALVARVVIGRDAEPHWAVQPVATEFGGKKGIDDFVSARLQKVGLEMGPEADRTTLIRRPYFDLVGLPPSPERVREFVGDKAPQA